MANASGRPLSADDTQSRERLLCAAREQFSKRGYAATTTRDIARVAGINPAMIRYYFNNKAGLFQAVLHETIQPMLSMMHSAPMQSEQPDMLALVQQYQGHRQWVIVHGFRRVQGLVLLEQAHYPVRAVDPRPFGDRDVEIEAVLYATAVDAAELDAVLATLAALPGVLQAFWNATLED